MGREALFPGSFCDAGRIANVKSTALPRTGALPQSQTHIESQYLDLMAPGAKSELMNIHPAELIADLARATTGARFRTILADPPWRFVNRTGKIAPEHQRLSRYKTLSTEEICALP